MEHEDPGRPFGKACAMFLEETRAHIARATACLHVSDEGERSQAREQLRAGFHRMKGGAGFFGYKEIETLSREIEGRLNKVDALSDPLDRKRLNELCGMLEEQLESIFAGKNTEREA